MKLNLTKDQKTLGVVLVFIVLAMFVLGRFNASVIFLNANSGNQYQVGDTVKFQKYITLDEFRNSMTSNGIAVFCSKSSTDMTWDDTKYVPFRFTNEIKIASASGVYSLSDQYYTKAGTSPTWVYDDAISCKYIHPEVSGSNIWIGTTSTSTFGPMRDVGIYYVHQKLFRSVGASSYAPPVTSGYLLNKKYEFSVKNFQQTVSTTPSLQCGNGLVKAIGGSFSGGAIQTYCPTVCKTEGQVIMVSPSNYDIEAAKVAMCKDYTRATTSTPPATSTPPSTTTPIPEPPASTTPTTPPPQDNPNVIPTTTVQVTTCGTGTQLNSDATACEVAPSTPTGTNTPSTPSTPSTPQEPISTTSLILIGVEVLVIGGIIFYAMKKK